MGSGEFVFAAVGVADVVGADRRVDNSFFQMDSGDLAVVVDDDKRFSLVAWLLYGQHPVGWGAVGVATANGKVRFVPGARSAP